MRTLSARWWLVGTLCAGAGGWLLGRQYGTAGVSASSMVSQPGVGASGSPVRGVPGRGVGGVAESDDSPAGRFSAALRSPDPAERMKQFLSALEQMTPGNAGKYN